MSWPRSWREVLSKSETIFLMSSRVFCQPLQFSSIVSLLLFAFAIMPAPEETF